MHTYRTAGGGGAGAGGSDGAAVVVAAPIATNAIIVVLCGALGSRLEHSVIGFFCLTYLATLNESKTEPKHRTSLAVVQCERHASPQAAAPPAHTPHCCRAMDGVVNVSFCLFLECAESVRVSVQRRRGSVM